MIVEIIKKIIIDLLKERYRKFHISKVSEDVFIDNEVVNNTVKKLVHELEATGNDRK